MGFAKSREKLHKEEKKGEIKMGKQKKVLERQSGTASLAASGRLTVGRTVGVWLWAYSLQYCL